MSRESAAAKGARLLTEGRLIVEAAGPGFFAATVRGTADVHLVEYARGRWTCSCDARLTCSHKSAAALIAAPDPLVRRVAFATTRRTSTSPKEKRSATP